MINKLISYNIGSYSDDKLKRVKRYKYCGYII